MGKRVIRTMSKIAGFFGGRSPLNQTEVKVCNYGIRTGGQAQMNQKNLLSRDALVGDKTHGEGGDDRRAVVAGVGGGESQEGRGEDECLHGGGLGRGLGSAENM